MTIQSLANFASNDSMITRQLARTGYAVVDNYLPGGQITTIREEMARAWQNGSFRNAAVGPGTKRALQPAIRNDRILWLEEAACSSAQQGYLASLDILRKRLNRELLLGLFNFEGHMAVYPPGARYQRHIDQFRNTRTRRVSSVLYLNDGWDMDDGGALRLYLDNDKLQPYQDIYPYAGRLVTFLSDRFYHEVLPARRARYSIAGWFRQRDNTLAG